MIDHMKLSPAKDMHATRLPVCYTMGLIYGYQSKILLTYRAEKKWFIERDSDTSGDMNTAIDN